MFSHSNIEVAFGMHMKCTFDILGPESLWSNVHHMPHSVLTKVAMSFMYNNHWEYVDFSGIIICVFVSNGVVLGTHGQIFLCLVGCQRKKVMR